MATRPTRHPFWTADEALYLRVKTAAKRAKQTMTAFVEHALRSALHGRPKSAAIKTAPKAKAKKTLKISSTGHPRSSRSTKTDTPSPPAPPHPPRRPRRVPKPAHQPATEQAAPEGDDPHDVTLVSVSTTVDQVRKQVEALAICRRCHHPKSAHWERGCLASCTCSDSRYLASED